MFAAPSPRGSPRGSFTPRAHIKQVNNYTEQEMIAEARQRLGHNQKLAIMKQMLSEKTKPGTEAVATKDLLLAAKLANVEVPAELVAETRHAARRDGVGAPTQIKWKPFVSEIPAPALTGHGNFGDLPALRATRRAQITQAIEDPSLMVEQGEQIGTFAASPKVKDKDVAHYFALLVSKIRDRFTEVRRAFRLLDEDCDGFLNYDEFKKILGMFNLDNMPDAIFDRIVRLIDKNGDGTVTFAEFGKLVSSDNAKEAMAIVRATD